jgi:hypothetical protein
MRQPLPSSKIQSALPVGSTTYVVTKYPRAKSSIFGCGAASGLEGRTFCKLSVQLDFVPIGPEQDRPGEDREMLMLALLALGSVFVVSTQNRTSFRSRYPGHFQPAFSQSLQPPARRSHCI